MEWMGMIVAEDWGGGRWKVGGEKWEVGSEKRLAAFHFPPLD
jgi:hypothetical protein